MTAPQQNLLIPSRYQLVFNRLPQSVFYCARVTIPGIELPSATQPTPFVDLPVPGDKLRFNQLEVTFLMDTNFSAWQEIFTWMQALGKPQSFDQYANLSSIAVQSGVDTSGVRPPYADAILTIYTSKNNPQFRYGFHDCFPVLLSGVPLDYQQSADQVIDCTVSFQYSYYTFEAIT